MHDDIRQALEKFKERSKEQPQAISRSTSIVPVMQEVEPSSDLETILRLIEAQPESPLCYSNLSRPKDDDSEARIHSAADLEQLQGLLDELDKEERAAATVPIKWK